MQKVLFNHNMLIWPETFINSCWTWLLWTPEMLFLTMLLIIVPVNKQSFTCKQQHYAKLTVNFRTVLCCIKMKCWTLKLWKCQPSTLVFVAFELAVRSSILSEINHISPNWGHLKNPLQPVRYYLLTSLKTQKNLIYTFKVVKYKLLCCQICTYEVLTLTVNRTNYHYHLSF